MFDFVLYVFVPVLGSALIFSALISKLIAMGCEMAAVDRKFTELAKTEMTPVLRRPSYRPRWRFPFRTLRSASLWVILTVVASRSRVRCTPEPRPVPTIIDCARDDSHLARIGYALAAAALTETVERLRR